MWSKNRDVCGSGARCLRFHTVTRSLGDGEVEYVHKYKFWYKNSALEKLGKHLAMFIENRRLTGANGGPIQVKTTVREFFDEIDGNDTGIGPVDPESRKAA